MVYKKKIRISSAITKFEIKASINLHESLQALGLFWITLIIQMKAIKQSFSLKAPKSPLQ